MRVLGVIPARYASTRFPGKPLTEIGGKSMILRVYEQACLAKSLTNVVVATDDHRIAEHVEKAGVKAIITKQTHRSGTERCAEVIELLNEKYDVIVNIQGDEPFVSPLQIETLSEIFLDSQINIATLIKRISNNEELFNQNVVKVVINKRKEAMYFSRSTIPFVRSCDAEFWIDKSVYYKHLGIYAYRTEILKKIVLLDESEYEKSESLEQLRWLENGYKINTIITDFESVAIDTPEDIEKANLFLKLKEQK
jgi:3-deoxy-manno-octulosonate cytidylyltransferase (CMP-KDO synthetase)